jgi:hypothetical protein
MRRSTRRWAACEAGAPDGPPGLGDWGTETCGSLEEFNRSILSIPQSSWLDNRTPRAYAAAGYYPTHYCVRYEPASRTYRVTLEGLVYRQAG